LCQVKRKLAYETKLDTVSTHTHTLNAANYAQTDENRKMQQSEKPDTNIDRITAPVCN